MYLVGRYFTTSGIDCPGEQDNCKLEQMEMNDWRNTEQILKTVIVNFVVHLVVQI